MESINVRGYGSLVNAMGNQTRSLKPELGIGVTELMYSDRHPFTVTKIISDTKIEVTADTSTRIDENGASESQEYRYEPDKKAVPITLRLNKFGRWKMVGDPKGSTFLVGRREEYYDFTR